MLVVCEFALPVRGRLETIFIVSAHAFEVTENEVTAKGYTAKTVAAMARLRAVPLLQ
jgi:hypothetical protein